MKKEKTDLDFYNDNSFIFNRKVKEKSKSKSKSSSNFWNFFKEKDSVFISNKLSNN